MRVIYKAPGLPAEIRDVPNTLEALQELVGGHIETVTVATDAAIICNEEGWLLGLDPNCTLLGFNFVGPIVVAGVAGEEFTDLPEEGVKVFLDTQDPRYGGLHIKAAASILWRRLGRKRL